MRRPSTRSRIPTISRAIEAGIAQKIEETRAIADNPAEPTFENTFVAMEKSGRLIDRVMSVFNGVTGANMNPALQAVQDAEAAKLAAMQDAVHLNAKLFQARLENLRGAPFAASRC